jgi:hypothetical protein
MCKYIVKPEEFLHPENFTELLEAQEQPYNNCMRLSWSPTQDGNGKWAQQFHPCVFPAKKVKKDFGPLSERAYKKLIETFMLDGKEDQFPANIIQTMNPKDLCMWARRMLLAE